MPIKHAVLISDGISEPGDFNSLAAWARERGISISAMAVGEGYDRALLNALSAGTGGRLYAVSSVDEIPSLILEDRMSRARTVFSQERVAIRGVSGLPAGFVDGMARLSSRGKARS
jgi:Ca-activated chloride channel homolog